MHKKKITIVEGSPKNVKFRRSLLHFKTFSTKTKTAELLSINLEALKEILISEPQNRVNEDVKKLIPFIKKIPYFYEFLSLNVENDDVLENLIIEFSWILCLQTFEKNLILQKTKEYSDNFYLVLHGSIAVLDLVITKECMTEEEYVLFLVKMFWIKEYEIIKICIKYNKDILNVDNENIEKFCNSGYKFKYKELKLKALRDLYKNNFEIYHYKNIIPSLEQYLNITKIETQVKKQSDDKNIIKKYFYIPHYEKVGVLERGRYINNLIKNSDINYQDKYTYITLEKTEIGIIQKPKYDRPILFNSLAMKKEILINSSINNFYLFKEVNAENFAKKYSKYFIYKKYLRGEKLISQNSIYDGVYLLLNGNCKVSTERSLEELNGLMMSFQYSLEGFNEYLSNLKTEQIEREKEDFIRNPIYQSEEYAQCSKGIKIIDMINLFPNEVIATNEYYNFKSEFYHYSVTITTGQATIIFIPKIIFHQMVSNDLKIREKIIKKVELRAKLFIGKIKNFKEELMKDIKWKMLARENKHKMKLPSNSNPTRNNRVLFYTMNNKQFNTSNYSQNNNHNIIENNKTINNDSYFMNPTKTGELKTINLKSISMENKIIPNSERKVLHFKNKSYNIEKFHISNNPSLINNNSGYNTTKISFNSINSLRRTHYASKTISKPINICSKTFFSGFPFSVIQRKETQLEENDDTFLPMINKNNSKYSTIKTFSL